MRLGEQIGLALGCLADVEVDEGLKVALEHNYSAIEILGDESFSDLGMRGLWPWEERVWNLIKPMLEPFRFKGYHAPYDNLNFMTLNPIIRDAAIEQIKASIDIAAEMGLSPVIVHPGRVRADMDERLFDLLITTFLKEVAAYAEEKQVKVAVETCEVFADLSIAEKYIAQVESPYLGICLDFNQEMAEKNDLINGLESFISNHSDRLFHCRFHGMESEATNLGLEYKQIMKSLIDHKYQGAVIFQIVNDAIDNLNETRDVIYKVG